MNHFTDAELAWHALEPDPEITSHLKSCSNCEQRYAFIQRLDAGLADVAAWQFPVDYSGRAEARRHILEIQESRLADEIAEAKEHLEPLIRDDMAFIWQDVARKARFQTAGAVRVLTDAAFEYLERDSLHARNLADAAVTIARNLGESHYLGRKVHQLIGRALKEKADAHSYLGEFSDALNALDDARHSYDIAGVTPWEYGVLLYVRGVVCFKTRDFAQADQCARDSAKLFAMSGDTTRQRYARLLGATLAWARFDYRRARDEYQAVLDTINAAENELLAARVTGYIANCDLDLGNTPAAAPALSKVLHTYARFGLLTEVARIRWALARVPLMEDRIDEAISLLRASKTELEHLQQRQDVALVTLDLAEALLASKGSPAEVRQLCSSLVVTFKAAGMGREALTAVSYLRETSRAGTITSVKVRHVRRFLERLDAQPSLVFAPPLD